MNRGRCRARWTIAAVALGVTVASGVCAEPKPPEQSPQQNAKGDHNGRSDTTFVFRASLSYGFRTLMYNQQLSDFFPTVQSFPAYNLDHGVGIGIEGEVYPFVESGKKRTLQPGLVASYRKEALLADSKVEGLPVDASSSEWLAGARLRIPLGKHEIGVSAGVGSHGFSLSSGARNPVPVPVPDVQWTFVRLALDGRLETRPLFLGASFGYRAPFGAGEIGSYDWFPRLVVTGIDATVYAGAPLAQALDLTVGYELRRYVFSAKSKPGDSAVAGGGLDLYGSGFVALALRL